jgi:hypothetical protein
MWEAPARRCRRWFLVSDKPNPLDRLLRELNRAFAAAAETPEDERGAYIIALIEMAGFLQAAGSPTASRRLTDLAYALRDLDNGRVVPVLQKSERTGSPPDNSVTWRNRVRVLIATHALQKSGMDLGAAAEHMSSKFPEVERLMERGKDLEGTIGRWRRELDAAKPGTFLADFSDELVHAENAMARDSLSLVHWRQFAEFMLKRIRP